MRGSPHSPSSRAGAGARTAAGVANGLANEQERPCDTPFLSGLENRRPWEQAPWVRIPPPAAKLDDDDVARASPEMRFSMEREHSMPFAIALATIIRLSSGDVAGYATARVELEDAA
jgi:hypothetical protein